MISFSFISSLRTAPNLWGPYSAPIFLYRVPKTSSNPFLSAGHLTHPNVHPELTKQDGQVPVSSSPFSVVFFAFSPFLADGTLITCIFLLVLACSRALQIITLSFTEHDSGVTQMIEVTIKKKSQN